MLNNMRLVNMYTVHGRIRVNADDLANPSKTVLPVYNQRGEKCETLEGRRCWGVHRDNMAKTKAEAVANRERVYRELFPDLHK